MSLPRAEGIILPQVKTSPSCVKSLSTHGPADLPVFIDEALQLFGVCR